MTILRHSPAGLIASGVFALALLHAGAASASDMIVNAKTGKCLTIAGGTSPANNIEGVQFNCDSDPSRRWILREIRDKVYEIINVKTRKCLTIAGGRSTANSLPTVQFDCDRDPSRTWRITDVTGSGVYQVRNMQTNKCLTIEGGTSSANNLRAVQFDCDDDLSRRWTMRDKL
jgi:cytolethal distending toxin subunit A